METSKELPPHVVDSIRGLHTNDETSSESEQETEPSSWSHDTPRSVSSDDSSALTSPRANLLWDHAFEVSKAEPATCKSPQEREHEWRRFYNKTDDDKLIADKHQKLHELSKKTDEKSENVSESTQRSENKAPMSGLPDLIASTSTTVDQAQRGRDWSPAPDASPPPLPHTAPPEIGIVDFQAGSPPPLPCTSPPHLSLSWPLTGNHVTQAQIDEGIKRVDAMLHNSDKILHTYEQTDNKNQDQMFESQASDHCIYDDASSSAGDEDYDPYLGDSNNDYDGVYNVQTNTVMETNKDETYAGSDEEFDKILQQLDQAEDLESEFDAILRALNAEREPQETYVQRFAERRDRYGFILSPVMEASSPSPSLLSGYSGVSCASPDRFDTFRMSPAIGAKPELDLASLCVKSPDPNSRNLASPQGRDDHDYTVPIFQARRAIVIPEVGYGWDSGDDLLSPTVSCEWDKDEHGGLNTPPVSTSGINFTQFGTRIGGGWRQADVVIHEENEDQSDDTVEANSDSDTDTTIESDTERNSKLNSSHNSVFLTDLENTIGETRLTPRTNTDEINHNSADELLELEEEIDKITHELSQINRRNESLFDDSYDDLEASKQVETSDTNISVISLESSLNDSYKGFSAELYKIHHQADRSDNTGETMFRSPIVRLDSKQTMTTSDDDECHSTESNEDAEDEYSESDDENVDFEAFKTKPVPKPPALPFAEQREDSKVSEVLSPRSAIILSGGMFPHETESSSYTSSTDDEEYERNDRQLTVKQYTSGDSDTSAKDTLTTGQDVINKKSDTGNKNESQVKVSLRQMYELKSPPQNQTETVSSPSKSITIHSPMDYYLLENTKIDTARKTELRQSPRIFGRYYAEMDKDIVNEVRSPREKENAINFENNELNDSKPEVDYLKERQQFEDSFTDVVLTKKEQLPFMTSPDKQAKLKESQPSAVKIKIGHLHRSSSARSKVKRGYVHELSEIFDQKQDHTEKHVVVKKENIKQEKAIIRKSPEKLTAKENIIITQEDSPAELLTLQEFNSSQGFEVTPLTKVETFHEQNATLKEIYKHQNVKYRNTDDTHDDNVHDNVHSNSDLEDTIEAQMKLYEDHLKTADTSGDEANDNDVLNATEPFEPHVGLCSLEMPLQFTQASALHLAAANVYEGSAIEVAKQERVKEDRTYMEQAKDDEDIPEIIDGDSSDLSSDEEYHNEYHLTGNIIHPERDGCSSVSSTGKIQTRDDNNKDIFNVDITQQKTVDCQEIFKRVDHLPGSTNHDATKRLNTERPLTGKDVMSPVMWRFPMSKHDSTKKDSNYSGSTKGILYDIISRIDDRLRNTDIDKNSSKQHDNRTPDKQNNDERKDGAFVERSIKNFDSKRLDTNYRQSLHCKSTHPTEVTGFEIRYPASISRRLYGPYCRLRGIDPLGTSDSDEDSTCGTTPQGLSNFSEGDNWRGPYYLFQRHEQNNNEDDSLLSNYRPMRRESEFSNENHSGITELKYLDRNYSVCSSPRSVSGESDKYSIRSLSPTVTNAGDDGFSLVSYDVKTPLSPLANQQRINNGSNTITDFKINEAQHDTGEENNTLTNTKRNSHIKHKLLCTGAQSGKHESYSFESTSNFKTNFQSSRVGDSDNLNAFCTSDLGGENNEGYCGYSQMDNKGEMKNDLHQRASSVHMPAETTSREIASQRSAMSDGKLSKTGRPVNIHGFNNIPSLEKTQDAENAQMSSGGHLSNETTCSKNDNESPSASARTHTLVVVQTPGYQQVLEDEKGKLKVWPYSDIDNPDKVPVTLHKAKRGIHLSVSKGMSENKSRMTVFQSAEHSAEKPESRMVNKYKTSSVLSGDGSMGGIMKTHGESVQSVLLQDANGNALSEEELSALLPKIAESISKLDSTETEEILPGITQNITKLKSGGNLVITTMTRRVDEEETSSGHGSPVPDHPVLDVDDLEKSKLYLVQDSKGEFYYVEDVTSESQESAYFSNSRNTSESVSDSEGSPIFDRISKVLPIGGSGIEESTAAEILSAMYGGSGLQELEENEEEWSDRTYEYDFPRNDRGYSKDRFVTPYMVEEPNTLPRINESTNEKYNSSYRNSGGEAFVYGGGLAQSYSQMTHGVVPMDDTSSLQTANVQNTVSGGKTIERYTFESETTEFPPAVPVSLPPQLPPALDYADNQFSMMKVDMAPNMQEERIPIKYKPLSESEPERPIYKTVATIQTKVKEPPPPKKEHREHTERKKYKIVSSKATEEQESHMRFDDFDYNFHTENVEYKVSPSKAQTQYFVRNTTNTEPSNRSVFRTEKKFEIGRNSDQKFKSEIHVRPQPEAVEESSYTYEEMRSRMEQERSDSSMHVVRGSYLIKNTLDDDGGALDDNINMFDGRFELCKDNPLYKSDEDLRIDRKSSDLERAQERFNRKLTQDLTFETVDRFMKKKNIEREPEQPRQSLTELLLSRLSLVDRKHIRQTIDVKHDHQDIYGDPRFLHADGETSYGTAGTSNFDTVGEKVDLILKGGKAFITVTVTAERVTPVDIEFNVWRKNQAIVTRVIEVDLLATEQRRRLYYKVMESPTGRSHGAYSSTGQHETVLDSYETLELFTKILGAADGEGDTETTEVKTRYGRTTRPLAPGIDLLY